MAELSRVGRVLRLFVWVSAILLWLQLAAIYMTNASPLDGFRVTVSWDRSGHH